MVKFSHTGDYIMKNKELLRTIKFTAFSLSAGVIQIGSYALFSEVLKLEHWLSYLVALVLSVLWNFTLNRKYTFKSNANITKAMILVALFYLVFTPLSTTLEYYLADVYHINGYLVTLLNMVLNLVLEFLYQRFVVYRNSIDTNAKGNKQ